MQRRHLLQLGLASAATISAVGAGLVWYQGPSVEKGQLTALGRATLMPLGEAMLDGLWPAAPGRRALHLSDWLATAEAAILALSQPAQTDLNLALGMLAHPAGRWVLTRLPDAWTEASLRDRIAATTTLANSRSAIGRKIYLGLRDLSAAAWASSERNWSTLGYPGPKVI